MNRRALFGVLAGAPFAIPAMATPQPAVAKLDFSLDDAAMDAISETITAHLREMAPKMAEIYRLIEVSGGPPRFVSPDGAVTILHSSDDVGGGP